MFWPLYSFVVRYVSSSSTYRAVSLSHRYSEIWLTILLWMYGPGFYVPSPSLNKINIFIYFAEPGDVTSTSFTCKQLNNNNAM